MLEDKQRSKMATTSCASTTAPIFTDYYASLDNTTKARYREKVSLCGFDPYSIKKADFSDDLALLPKIEYPDIVNYLVLQTSWATNSQMKAYKSTEAYNFFVSGWVNTILMKKVGNEKVVVYGRVNHSQRARETPLKTWFLAENEGTVIAAHCDCMAGLCEVCSHVGALLYAVEAGTKMRDSVTCTGEKSKWMMPTYMKSIPYLPVSEMDFTSAKQKQSLLQEKEVTPSASRQNIPKVISSVTVPSRDEQQAFYTNISSSKSKPVILSLIKPFNEIYIPKVNSNVPKCLNETIYNPDYVKLDFKELQQKSDEVEIYFTIDECQAIEKATREQAQSKLWFQQRAGRITASQLKSACHTDPSKPSKSLIKTICYPEEHKFSNAATRWGCTNEQKAREAYQNELCNYHEHLTVSDSGLNVNPKWPMLGASPDGFVFCDCCGNGVCEIKCPYTVRDCTVNEAAQTKNNFCLLVRDSDGLCLDKKHAYYYQVQCQLFICEADYCDFVVYTTRGLHIERILPDHEFWNTAVPKAMAFFSNGILPELMGKYYTRPGSMALVTPSDPTESTDDEEGPWCTCQQFIEDSELIGCDNEQCNIQWFHMSCVNLEQAPEGKWFCPACQMDPS